LVLIYSHPEYYPPTLNALDELATAVDEIEIIYRPFLKNNWDFPKNVILKPSGIHISRKESMQSNFISKTFFHFQFILNVFRSVISKKYNTILVYDHLAMLSLYLVSSFLSKNTALWYHNHDVPLLDNGRKFSIGWMAIHAQNRLLKKISIFSLPTKERLNNFKISDKTKVFVIPNYPSKKKYFFHSNTEKKLDSIALIYQGTISKGHGLEEITFAINESNLLGSCRLSLVGNISLDFKSKLEEINLKSVIDYMGYVYYMDLPNVTSQSHIGIAVLIPKSINFKTASLASNKIYEYAACGLPVLYFNDPHYKEYLTQFEWAFATDLSLESIEDCILAIMSNFIILLIYQG
jgi:hypothetical protein